jgi:hypothetical protein
MSLTAILYGQKIVDSQQSYYDELNTKLISKGIKVELTSDLASNAKTQNALDTAKINLKENSFAVFETTGDKTKFVDYKNNISTKFNWIEVFGQFADNYASDELDDGFYKWGQIVPETGDYLCKDCGYIAEFQQGDIFPICEVCQAGEPDGPSTPDQGYWERV